MATARELTYKIAAKMTGSFQAAFNRSNAAMAKNQQHLVRMAQAELRVAKANEVAIRTGSRESREELKQAQASLKVAQAEEKHRQSLGRVSAAQSRVASGAHRASGAMGGMLKGMLGMAAGYLTITGLKTVYKDLIDVYKSSQIHETNFQTLMRKAPGATKPQLDALKKYATAQSKVGLVSKGVIKEGMAQLATFKLTAPQIQRLTGGMLDLAVRTHGLNVTQEQLQLTANQVGKVFTGQVGALRRVGISFDKHDEHLMKTGTQEQKVATLAKVLEDNFGGVNRQLAKTDAGRMILWEHTLNSMKATMGEKLIPLQVKWMNFVISHMPQIERAFNGIVRVIEWTVDKGGKLFSYFEQHWGTLKYVIGGVVGAILLVEGAMKTAMAINAISNAITVVRTLKSAWFGVAAAEDAATVSAGRLAGASGLGGLGGILGKLAPFARVAGPAALVTGAYLMGKETNRQMQAGISSGQRAARSSGDSRRAQYSRLNYSMTSAQIDALARKEYGGGIDGFNALSVAQMTHLANKYAAHHANGGLVTRQSLSWLAEQNRPELVLPLTNRPRTQELLQAHGLGGMNVSLSVTVNGGGPATGVESAVRMTIPEFRRMLSEVMQQQRRVSYAG